MVKIISFFIHLLHTIRSFLYKFECFLLRFLPNDPSQKPTSDAYRRFKVNELPIIDTENIPIPFEEAKLLYEKKHKRPLKPSFRKEGKVYPAEGTVCPHCGATHEYLSFNNGKKRSQIRCKVCEHTFSLEKTYSQQVVRKCPHYLNELKQLSMSDKERYKKEPSAFSLHTSLVCLMPA